MSTCMMHHLRFVYIIRFLIYLLQEPLDNHVIRLLEMEAYISTRSFFLRSHSLSDSWSKQQPRGDQDCSSQRTHECWTFGATGVHKPLSSELSEQYQCDSVNSWCGTWILVVHQLIALTKSHQTYIRLTLGMVETDI